MIQAIFWDYDNTILSTAEAHWKKHQIVLARHGIDLNEKFRKRVYENNGNQNWLWMKDELGLNVPEKKYLEEIDLEFQKYILNLELRPGVMELFQFFKKLDIPQAIITNARRNSAKPVLDAKNISSLMQFILFKEDYEDRKPSPIPYLKGFEKMAMLLNKPIEAHKCIAIEDDPKGVESANKAGAIVIHRKLKEDDPNSPYADYCCFHKDDLEKIIRSLVVF